MARLQGIVDGCILNNTFLPLVLMFDQLKGTPKQFWVWNDFIKNT